MRSWPRTQHRIFRISVCSSRHFFRGRRTRVGCRRPLLVAIHGPVGVHRAAPRGALPPRPHRASSPQVRRPRGSLVTRSLRRERARSRPSGRSATLTSERLQEGHEPRLPMPGPARASGIAHSFSALGHWRARDGRPQSRARRRVSPRSHTCAGRSVQLCSLSSAPAASRASSATRRCCRRSQGRPCAPLPVDR